MRPDKINSIQDILKLSIHFEINQSVHNVIKNCSKLKKTPQEPDFVASMTLNFTPKLFSILKHNFPKIKFSVTGIFCHQKPIVDIGEAKNPELGDILFVYIYTNDKGEKRYNSLLLQAKMSGTSTVKNSSTDFHQLKLYNEWPEFKYSRAGRLNGTKRNIIPKTFNDGAQYLLINSYALTRGVKALKFPMACAIAEETLIVHNSLSTELVEFLKFKAGRTFESDPNTTEDDWTKMIWDLLEISKGKFSNRKNSGLKNFPRQILIDSDDDVISFISDREMNSFFSINNDSNVSEFDEIPGISVIVIESSEDERESNRE